MLRFFYQEPQYMLDSPILTWYVLFACILLAVCIDFGSGDLAIMSSRNIGTLVLQIYPLRAEKNEEPPCRQKPCSAKRLFFVQSSSLTNEGSHIVRCWLVVVTVVGTVLFGCGKTPDEYTARVTYRLKWLYNTSVIGSLYAKAHGFFKEQGMEVTIKEGGPARDAIKELELGHAQFGVASADQVIRALSKGAPVVVIAQLFQENPLQWVYRPNDTVIKTAHDLKDKTIGITFGGNDETIMKALMAKYEITNDAVTLFSVRYDYTPFYDGHVDLWPVYQNTQGIIIQKKLAAAGETIQFFNPASDGVRFVANSVITTERILAQQPKLVMTFTAALLRGWREALDPKNRKKAVKTISRFDKNTPVETIEKQLEATRLLIKPSENMVIGSMDRKAWDQTEKIMLEQGLISQPVNVLKNLKPIPAP